MRHVAIHEAGIERTIQPYSRVLGLSGLHDAYRGSSRVIKKFCGLKGNCDDSWYSILFGVH